MVVWTCLGPHGVMSERGWILSRERLLFHCSGTSGHSHSKTPQYLGTKKIFNSTRIQIVKSFKGLEISFPAVLGRRAGPWGKPFFRGPSRQLVPTPLHTAKISSHPINPSELTVLFPEQSNCPSLAGMAQQWSIDL